MVIAVMTELVNVLGELEYSEITIAWIASHVGLAGNEKADLLAKEGLTQRQKLIKINNSGFPFCSLDPYTEELH